MSYKKYTLVKGLLFFALASFSALVGSTAALATSGNYGPGALYQVEISANAGGPTGGGVWLWLSLYPDGSVDYSGSDCGHGGVGATSDKGDASWHYVNSGTQIEIDGVLLNGLPTDPVHGNFSPYQTTIKVPSTTGHYKGSTVSSYLTLPYYIDGSEGWTQLQVAP